MTLPLKSKDGDNLFKLSEFNEIRDKIQEGTDDITTNNLTVQGTATFSGNFTGTGTNATFRTIDILATGNGDVPIKTRLPETSTDNKFISFERMVSGSPTEVGAVIYDTANDQLEFQDIEVTAGSGGSFLLEDDRPLNFGTDSDSILQFNSTSGDVEYTGTAKMVFTTGLFETPDIVNGAATLTLPSSTDTLVGRATTDTLTNKTLDLTDNTLNGTLAEFNTAVSDATLATLTGTETLTNKTITSATLTGTTTYTNAGAGSDPTLASNDTNQTLTLTGRLGIGESVAEAPLHVTNDQAALTEVRLDNSDVSGSMAYTFYDGSNERANITYDTAAALLDIRTTVATGQIAFSTNTDVEALRIDDSQNVDIVSGALNMAASGNIQDAGVDAIAFDGSQNVSISGGNLTISGDLDHDGTNVGFYGTLPVAQATAIGKLTNSLADTTTDGTLEDIGDTSAGDVSPAIERNLSELNAKIDALIDALGGTAGVGLTAD